jgi:transcriptional regulator with XRE-family HTH domain
MKRAQPFTPNCLRKYRLLLGYDQAEVAFLLGLKGRGRISEWEQGTSKPGLDNLLQLCIIYRTQPEELYYDLRQEFIKDIHGRLELLQQHRARDG